MIVKAHLYSAERKKSTYIKPNDSLKKKYKIKTFLDREKMREFVDSSPKLQENGKRNSLV